MSVPLPTSLLEYIYSREDGDPCILLLQIDLPSLGTPLRLARNVEDIVWNGETWTRFNFELDTIGDVKKGELPQLQIQVSNITRAVQGYVDDADGGVKSLVTLYAIHGGNLAETTPLFSVKYSVTQCNTNSKYVTFTIGGFNAFLNRFPRNKALKTVCPHTFKGSRCKYSGPETSCNHSLTRCGELNNTSNFGGFVGIGYRGVRV